MLTDPRLALARTVAKNLAAFITGAGAQCPTYGHPTHTTTASDPRDGREPDYGAIRDYALADRCPQGHTSPNGVRY